ncbi:MAG: hypothetical protein CVU49_09370 [Candidatus Cloacimonetes bacterium HGW-Cloacimonetes-2]|jgi:hypothetical protein|nr:MAG: hypothetical protein CVU49_09370 [Candidatus Cloacimonetes bacterium HGW-Cloacimonetes-2]
MKNLLILTVLAVALLGMVACAGEDNPDTDNIPPVPPTLIPHLGDTGDNYTFVLTEENNGLDTVPEGNWIRVTWNPFIDTDLSHIKIYRYDNINPVPALIDSIMANRVEYLDSRSQLEERVIYSYFIDLVDTSGNSARSDTVSYGLLAKSMLIGPDNNATVAPGNITFSWNRSGFASKFRVLVWDENYNYVWHQDLVVSAEEDPLWIIFPVNLAQEHSGESLRWRVDSFDWDEELQGFMGSESQERIMHIQ